MEIKLKMNVDSVGRAGTNPVKPRNSQSGVEGPSFTGTDALNQALAETADVRAEKVERAKQLVKNSSYPPPETINKIATLLAMNIPVEQ